MDELKSVRTFLSLHDGLVRCSSCVRDAQVIGHVSDRITHLDRLKFNVISLEHARDSHGVRDPEATRWEPQPIADQVCLHVGGEGGEASELGADSDGTLTLTVPAGMTDPDELAAAIADFAGVVCSMRIRSGGDVGRFFGEIAMRLGRG